METKLQLGSQLVLWFGIFSPSFHKNVLSIHVSFELVVFYFFLVDDNFFFLKIQINHTVPVTVLIKDKM